MPQVSELIWTLHSPPPLLEGGGSKFWLPLPEVGYEKLKKGWKYGPGAGLFKGGGAGTFPI